VPSHLDAERVLIELGATDFRTLVRGERFYPLRQLYLNTQVPVSTQQICLTSTRRILDCFPASYGSSPERSSHVHMRMTADNPTMISAQMKET
jgi:hypothetical protein